MVLSKAEGLMVLSNIKGLMAVNRKPSERLAKTRPEFIPDLQLFIPPPLRWRREGV
jgi:hypothetical protein